MAIEPSDTPYEMLASKAYWDARYAADPLPFDSLQRYSTCASYREALAPVLPPKNGSLLVVGAGTSRLAEELVADGFSKVMTIDFSEAAVELLNSRHASAGLQASVKNIHGDVRAMDEVTDAYVDAVLDKATLDSLLCAEDGDVAENSSSGAEKYVEEVARVLKPGGRFVVLSLGPPEERLSLLQAAGLWSATDHRKIEKPASGPDNHFLYTLTRAK